MKNEVIIYTDGASRGNPGPGAWAAVLISGKKRREISGAVRMTTNNRMEIQAALEALSVLKNQEISVKLHSDSRLLVDTFEKGWIHAWVRNGWRKKDKSPVLNDDLLKPLYELVNKFNVKFVWVKGHAGIEENERCDALVNEALDKGIFEFDSVYEATNGGKKESQTPSHKLLAKKGNFELTLKEDDSYYLKKGASGISFEKNEIDKLLELLCNIHE